MGYNLVLEILLFWRKLEARYSFLHLHKNASSVSKRYCTLGHFCIEVDTLNHKLLHQKYENQFWISQFENWIYVYHLILGLHQHPAESQLILCVYYWLQLIFRQPCSGSKHPAVPVVSAYYSVLPTYFWKIKIWVISL